MAKKTTIRCPHCGCEYLPAEIYFPDQFLGRPSNIIKDEKGDVLGFSGNDMNTYETYYCDKCNQMFSVEASITFKTAPAVDLFAEDDDFKDIKKLK